MPFTRTMKRVIRLFTLAALIALLSSAAASPAYAEGTWTEQLPAPPSGFFETAMASLGGDQVLLVDHYSETTWVYDLSDNTWTRQYPTSSPPGGREQYLASLGGDQVLLFDSSSETWVYDLGDNTWMTSTPLPPRSRDGVLPWPPSVKAMWFVWRAPWAMIPGSMT